MYRVDIGGNVTLYGQEICTWCGAACAQMSRNGYPNPGDRLYYTQTALWNTIQTFNSTLPQDTNWATDPPWPRRLPAEPRQPSRRRLGRVCRCQP